MICNLFTSCESGSSYYTCDWLDDHDAEIENAHLLLPRGDTCGYVFQNTILENVVNTYSIYNVMSNVSTNSYIGSGFDFNWTVTIVNKICSSQQDQNRKIIFNQDNYTNHISFTHCDKLTNSPYVPEHNYITPYDHKHEYVFIVHGVTNEYDGNIGNITWQCYWSFPTIPADSWIFNSPPNGIVGTFTPSRGLAPRYIYMNGTYQYM